MKAKTVKALSKGRAIHLIDIENLCMESNPTEEHVALAKAAYFQKVKPGPNDHFYVTVSSKVNRAAAMFGWGNASFGCKEGHDGADYLLAELMVDGQLGDRFEKVYLASGDGGLAPFASSLINQGIELEIVSVPEALSVQYRFIGAPVTYIRPDLALAA
jgi:hypothetical protein